MITFRCPNCLELQEMVLKQNLLKSVKTTCIKCGSPLILMLVVATEEFALRKLFQKKEEKLNGTESKKEGQKEAKAEEANGSNSNWKRWWKKERG